MKAYSIFSVFILLTILSCSSVDDKPKTNAFDSSVVGRAQIIKALTEDYTPDTLINLWPSRKKKQPLKGQRTDFFTLDTGYLHR